MAYQIRLTSNNPTNVMASGGTNYMKFRVWDTVTRRYINIQNALSNYNIWNHSPNIFTESTLTYNSDKTEAIVTYTVYRNYNNYAILNSTVGITCILDGIQHEAYIVVNQDASVEDMPIKLAADSVIIRNEEHFSLSTASSGDNWLPLEIAPGINPANVIVTYNDLALGAEMIDLIQQDAEEITIYFNEIAYNIDINLDVTFTYGDISQTLQIVCPGVGAAISLNLNVNNIQLPNFNTSTYTTSVDGLIYNPYPSLYSIATASITSNSNKIPTPRLTYTTTGDIINLNFTWQPHELDYDVLDFDIYKEAEFLIVLSFTNYSTTIVQKITFGQWLHAYIHFVEDKIVLDGNSKVNYEIPYIGDNGYKNVILDLPEWTTGYITDGKLVLTYIESNNTNQERTYQIRATVVYDNADETETTEIIGINLVQGATGNILAHPLWEDLLIKYTPNVESYNINIYGNLISEGTGFNITVNNPIVDFDININRYLQSYYEKLDLDFSSNMIVDNPLFVKVTDNYNNIIIDTTPIYYNYTYDENFYKNNEFLTAYYQIQDFFSADQYFISTVQDFIYEDIKPSIDVSDYNGSFIQQDTYNSLEDNTQTTFIQPIQWNAEKIVIYDNNFKQRRYTYTKSCKDYKYCLYYLNPAGGWNWFLAEGETINTDNYNRKTYLNDTTNIYYEELSTTYKLNSGLLNDRHSKLFKYVVQSPRCYLHDLINNKIIRVNIVDNKLTTQTFKSNNRKFCQYTITIEDSNKKYITL